MLRQDVFNEIRNGNMTFFPIDNASGDGVGELREKIEEVVLSRDCINDKIPVSFHRLLELSLVTKKDYLMLDEVRNIAGKCGLNEKALHTALMFLTRRGLVTFLLLHESSATLLFCCHNG